MLPQVYRAQEIRFRGEHYLLLPGGAIVPPNWQGEIGFAHLYDNGEVWRFNVQIGRIDDLELGDMVNIDVDADLLAGIVCTLIDSLGDTEDDTGHRRPV